MMAQHIEPMPPKEVLGATFQRLQPCERLQDTGFHRRIISSHYRQAKASDHLHRQAIVAVVKMIIPKAFVYAGGPEIAVQKIYGPNLWNFKSGDHTFRCVLAAFASDEASRWRLV